MDQYPKYTNGNVAARCPECRTPTTFEFRNDSREHGTIVRESATQVGEQSYSRMLYVLMRCAGCGRGGLAAVAANGRVVDGNLSAFFPDVPLSAELPSAVPQELVADVHESERCASVQSYRGAVALLRSVLERMLKLNGYQDPDPDKDRRFSLKARLKRALDNGVIAPTRWRQLDDGLREFANDILHELRYQPATASDFSRVHTYTQRVLEDFYGERAVVEETLREKGRLPINDPAAGGAG